MESQRAESKHVFWDGHRVTFPLPKKAKSQRFVKRMGYPFEKPVLNRERRGERRKR